VEDGVAGDLTVRRQRRETEVDGDRVPPFEPVRGQVGRPRRRKGERVSGQRRRKRPKSSCCLFFSAGSLFLFAV
jgi:hypothetical protein